MRPFVNAPVLTFVYSIAFAACAVRAQQAPPTAAQCYRMLYTRDSTDTPLPDRFVGDSPLPDHFRWSPVDSQARFWSESPTANAREAIKQTRGRASWRRIRADSVVIVLWSMFVSSGDIRFTSFTRPASGIVQWLDESNHPIERHTFVARAVTCPHLDPPGSER